MSTIDEIKARLDIIEVVGETVRLRRSGKNYIGFCPFHSNVHTPAFVVFPETGTWRCFGACNEGGDLFRYVMKKEGWDFPEALRHLAERAGVELRPHLPEEQAAEEAHARLRDLLELAASYYRSYLTSSAAGVEVRGYLHQRGLRDETLEAFEVGLAPAGWDTAFAHFRSQGAAEDDLVSAGLSLRAENGSVRDRFRNRITLPIRDMGGRLCGFGARVVAAQEQPKFLNSPQTPLFDKGRLLYGLHRAHRAIREQGQAVVVEGYFDVLALHQSGFPNAVSPMGTALTEAQLNQLKRLAPRMVLALDADAAGEAATLRGLDLAREALDREEESVFDARGLLRHEARLRADLRVAALPEGMDPDDVVLRDPDQWKALVAGAKTVVEHVLGVITQGRDLGQAKVKAEVAGRMLPLIEDVADPVEREAYRQELARRLHLGEEVLGAPGSQPPGRRRRPARPAALEAPGDSGAAAPAPPRELFCLGALVRQPSLLFRMDREFGELGLDRLGAEDFTSSENQWALGVVRDALAQEDNDPAQFVAAHLPPGGPVFPDSSRPILLALSSTDPVDPQDVFQNLLRLRKQRLGRQLSELRFFLMESAAGEAQAVSPSEELEQINRIRGSIQHIDLALAERGSGPGQAAAIPRSAEM
ncbi:MAG: DNA primase [Anaerolineales bacterium]